MAGKELLPSTITREDTSNWSQPVEGDLGLPPSLGPQLEDFLGGEMPPFGAEGGRWFLAEIKAQTLPEEQL